MTGRYSETLGGYLRRERESRSVSLEEVSRVTRIGLPILEALERDDFESIPQKEFILGFLRGYARHLGLPREDVLQRYRVQAELSSRKEKFHQMSLFPGTVPSLEEAAEAKAESPESTPPKEKRKIPWKILLQVAIVIIALGLSLYLHQALKKPGNGERDSAPGGPHPEDSRRGG
jgi:cytoskeletal protein RodZ